MSQRAARDAFSRFLTRNNQITAQSMAASPRTRSSNSLPALNACHRLKPRTQICHCVPAHYEYRSVWIRHLICHIPADYPGQRGLAFLSAR